VANTWTFFLERMKQNINEAVVPQVIVFLDQCHNDPVNRAESINPLTEEFAPAFDYDIRNREVRGKQLNQAILNWLLTLGIQRKTTHMRH